MKKTTTIGLSLGFLLSAAVAVPAGASEALATKGGCLACHDVSATKVGPAFKEVAAKYKGDAGAKDTLVAKVKNGGSGVWGNMPMPPTSTLSDDEIASVVDWILAM